MNGRCRCHLLALLAGFVTSLHATTRPPNIVVIMTDDQGYADVGVYGAKGYTTPNLDRLAREGTQFTNFHVAQSVCSASRASLLTGSYPSRVGIQGALFPNSPIGLNESETTLAELLKSRGYATGMAGKWHLGDRAPFLPDRHGFDESFCLPYSHDMSQHNPNAQRKHPPLPLLENGHVADPEITPEKMRHLTEWFTERAVRFIGHNRDRPFFFYLAHPMPHVPLAVSERFAGQSAQGLYGDVVTEIDWSVGEILRALAKHGLERNTLVIFLSDNGPWLPFGDHAGSAAPFREGKRTVWEGGTRVPCLMRWPDEIPAAAVNDRFVMNIDLLPTIAQRIGAPLPELTIDGLNVWPLLAGRGEVSNPHDGYAFWDPENELQAVVSGDGRWKLVLPHAYRSLAGQPGGRAGKPAPTQELRVTTPTLFDLQNDRIESADVARQHPDVVASLQVFAEKCRAELGDSLTKRSGSGVRLPGRIPTVATP